MGFGGLKLARGICAAALLVCAPGTLRAQNRRNKDRTAPTASGATVAQLEAVIRAKAAELAGSSGMKQSFEWFTTERNIPPRSIRYSDYVKIRLLFEATRDAGFWNMHWTITNQPPNSDNIWRQWKSDARPSYIHPTASAECDELSALFSFLAAREGVKSVGLFWPYPNHTVAVWTLHPANRPVIRVVVPTSQIFLTEWDDFDTRKFDPWTQKTIYDYRRQDVPDSFTLPTPLVAFFTRQIDKYAGASDSTLLQIRYLRQGIFLGWWTPEQAAQEALRRCAKIAGASREDSAAFENFAEDMRRGRPAK